MLASRFRPRGEGTQIHRLTRSLARARRRREVAHFLSAIALGAVIALAVVLALPDHDGITRAVARPGQAAPPAAVATVPHRVPTLPGPRLPEAQVTIGANATATNIPSSFLGLSTEYSALPLFDRDMPVFERVLSLLHVPGAGPLVLRVGGDSADHSFWAPKARKMPHWAFQLTPAWLKSLGAIVLKDHVRLIIDLNLVTDTPFTAVTWARAAETSLPHGSVVGFEIGNEPDLYEHSYWMAAISRSPLASVRLPLELTPSLYVQDFHAYATELAQSAPGVPIIGPALAHPAIDKGWISTLIGAERPSLAVVSAHMYPYSACVKQPRSTSFPTVARLLSERATAGIAAAVAPAVRLAHEAGLPFRMTELNSVTCEGRYGVSNTFATGLWAPDALFELARAGVNGVNLHVRAAAINAPFLINRSGLYARPLLYGLLMFARMLGPHTQLVHLQLGAKPSLHLKAWATRVSGGILHVLLIDKGSHAVRVNLHLQATGPATVQRLLAPSASSPSGATLNGQRLGPKATWIGQPRTETIPRGARGYVVTVARQSAALVGVHVSPPAPATTAVRLGRPARRQAGARSGPGPGDRVRSRAGSRAHKGSAARVRA